MEKAMKPFIFIYHVVNFIFTWPFKINSLKDGKLNKEEKSSIQDKNQGSYVPSSKDIKQNLEGIVPTKEKIIKTSTFPFRYEIRNSQGKKESGTIDAESVADARNFLVTEGYEVLKVEPRSKYDIVLFEAKKIKTADLSFALVQLSTYIKAGIPLVDSVRILAKQTTTKVQKKAYEKLVYDLLRGENLSDAMDKQGEMFPKLLINMIKTAEMTGDLPTILDDMADYYTQMAKTRKEMISALTYPAIVLCFAIAVLTFMLVFIVPKFVDMFQSEDAALPTITLIVINASNFIQANYIYIIIGLVLFILIYHYIFTNVRSFRKFMQTIFMRLPVIGKVIIYNEVFNFTKTFSSLLNHGVLITDSMEILSRITNNEVYKDIIATTLYNLSKGNSISSSFKGQWAFPVAAYEMLVTGENTGQLGLMMEKVSEHYQMLHKSIIDQLKSLIEPFMIALLAVIVGVILLSIVVPMFDIYGKIE